MSYADAFQRLSLGTLLSRDIVLSWSHSFAGKGHFWATQSQEVKKNVMIALNDLLLLFRDICDLKYKVETEGMAEIFNDLPPAHVQSRPSGRGACSVRHKFVWSHFNILHYSFWLFHLVGYNWEDCGSLNWAEKCKSVTVQTCSVLTDSHKHSYCQGSRRTSSTSHLSVTEANMCR